MISISINIVTSPDSLLRGAYADALIQIETETTGFFITTENGYLIGTG